MGMFFADDSYDESRRMEGFQRYKQLLSFYAGRWVKVNLLATLGALPLVLGAALLQVGYILLYVLFAPWTLALVPFVGLWFILLVCELMLYRPLDEAFQIEKQFVQIEGDPWRETT